MQSLRKILLPLSCIGIGFTPYFYMSYNFHRIHVKQIDDSGCTIFQFLGSIEDPVTPADGSKIVFLYPSFSFVAVPPPCPVPQHSEDAVIYIAKGFLGTDGKAGRKGGHPILIMSRTK